MRTTFTLMILIVSLASHETHGQPVPTIGGEYQKLFTTTSNPGWLEGPAIDAAGDVWFTDLGEPLSTATTSSNLYRYDSSSGKTDLKLENTGGANGLAFDADGYLVAAHLHDPKVTRRSTAELDDEAILVDKWEGKSLAGANDLTFDSGGGLYFTDAAVPATENAILYVSPDGDVQRYPTNVVYNNGIAISPDGNTLYTVSTGFGAVLAFDVGEKGALSNQRTFASPGRSNGRSFFPDGMTVDRFGNLYVADLAISGGPASLSASLTGSRIRIWNPDGDEIGLFEPPEGVVNMTFGSDDTLYFTSASSLWRVPLLFDVVGDCDNNSVLTAADLSCVSSIAYRDAVLSALGSVPGDLDGDGKVNFKDFLVLSQNFGGESQNYSDGNVDLEGGVSFSDFLALSANYGQSLGATASVPEPASMILLLAGFVAAFFRMR